MPSVLQTSPMGVMGAMFFGTLGVFLTFLAVIMLRQWWLIRRSDLDTVFDVGTGDPVMLEGSAEPVAETLESPFSRTECLAYYCAVDQYDPERRSEESNQNWTTVHSEERGAPFLLECDSGSMLVTADADPIELNIEDDTETFEVPADESPPSHVREYLDEHGVEVMPRSVVGAATGEASSTRRFREKLLLPGERTFASGVVWNNTEFDREFPAGTNAVLGPEETDPGFFQRWLTGPPTLVSDAPVEEVLRRKFVGGAVNVVFGLICLGVAAVLLTGLTS